MGCVTCEQLRARVADLEDDLAQKRRRITELTNRLNPPAPSDDVQAVFDYWREKCGHPNTVLTRDRKTKIGARLRDGYTVEQLRVAIDGAAHGAYVDTRGVKHDDIALICRGGEKVDLFISRAPTRGPEDLQRKLVGA